MIVGRQIRAARALLDMSQDDLAEAAGLTPQAIRKIEGGDVQPREGTIADITRVFNDRGLEFTENTGVRLKPNNIEVFEGPERFDEFYDFLFEHLRRYGGDVCLNVSNQDLMTKYRKDPSVHYNRMKTLCSNGTVKSYRILATKSDYFKKPMFSTFRWQPGEGISPTAFYAFGDCLALISFAHTPAPYVVVLKSTPLAGAYRQAFDAAWAAGKVPPSIGEEEG